MLFSFENLYRQYLACRRNKRNTLNALRFEARQEAQLLALREALVTRTYVPARSVCFFAQRPKLREIFAADFRDRVVHHVLVSYLERIWEPRFIHDSYACRRGKGVHAAVARLQQFIREATANGTRRAWYLQLDIRNYFMTIDRDILYAQVSAKLNDDDARWLAKVLIYHDCTEDYVYRGAPGAHARIPPHKTLTGVPKNKGLPIGNLNSQFFANVYLDAFDQFVKHTLKCRHYIRYCDDFVLLSPDVQQLRDWRVRIETYLREKLALELNTRRERLRPVSDGVDFLGYIVRRDYLLVRRRVVSNLKRKLNAFETELVRNGPRVRRCRFERERLDLLYATLNSYMGHMQRASTASLWRALWQRHAWLAAYFTFDPAALELGRRYLPPIGARRASQQYRHYRRQFPEAVVLLQVGKFFEFYEGRDAALAEKLDLAPMRRNARGARYGFPLAALRVYLLRLFEWRQAVVVIGETDEYLTAVKTRVPVCRYEALTAS